VPLWRASAAACKHKWGGEVKVTQPKQDKPGFPFPMAVHRAIPRTEAAKQWEIWELKVKLVLCGKPSQGGQAEGAVEEVLKVEVATDGVLPDEVSEAMGAAVLKEWARKRRKFAKHQAKKAALETQGGDAGPTFDFCLTEVLEWCELNYVEILSVLPVFVNRFIMEEATGGNSWHFCILEPTVQKKVELTEEEKESQRQGEILARIKELERQQKAELEADKLGEQRRREAEEDGPKARQLSRKEQDEMAAAKRGQGNRTAKTGARATKSNKAEMRAEEEKGKKKK